MLLIKAVLLLILLKSFANSIKVIEFQEQNWSYDYDDPSLSFDEISLPREVYNVTICSSHKLLQLNEHSSSFYTIFEDNSYKKGWLTLFMKKDYTLWLMFQENLWYVMYDDLDETVIMNWLHICLTISFKNQEVSVSFGSKKESKQFILNLKRLPKMNIR